MPEAVLQVRKIRIICEAQCFHAGGLKQQRWGGGSGNGMGAHEGPHRKLQGERRHGGGS